MINLLPCNSCGGPIGILKSSNADGGSDYIAACSNMDCPAAQIHTSEAEAVKAANIRYDLNAELVDQQQAMGEHIHYLIEVLKETSRLLNAIDKITKDSPIHDRIKQAATEPFSCE